MVFCSRVYNNGRRCKFCITAQHSESVSSFLTASQHIIGHFSAITGIKIKNGIYLTTIRRKMRGSLVTSKMSTELDGVAAQINVH